MPEMTIQMITDPDTHKKNILVKLSGEGDMLPHEHEQMHRKVVNKLLEGGILTQEELGKLVIQREEEIVPVEPVKTQTPQRQAQTQGH